MSMTPNRWRAGLALLLLAGSLAACGKAGAPKPPADEPNEYPRTYPSGHSDDDQR
jgi:predicted small lipoprotein YifL